MTGKNQEEEPRRSLDSFGETLRAYRKNRQLTQRTLAERSGLSSSHLGKVERGKRKPPRAQKVLSLVDALQISGDDAKRFVAKAGYDPLILKAGASLAYSTPYVGPTFYRTSSDRAGVVDSQVAERYKNLGQKREVYKIGEE